MSSVRCLTIMAASIDRTVRAAGFVIFRRKQQIEYLLMQASYGGHHWTPPKGLVDPGETDFDTATRETFEESGLKLDDLKVYEKFKRCLQYKVRGKMKTVVYWLAELTSNTSVCMSREHQDYRWLPLNETCLLAQFREMQELLRECDKFISTET